MIVLKKMFDVIPMCVGGGGVQMQIGYVLYTAYDLNYFLFEHKGKIFLLIVILANSIVSLEQIVYSIQQKEVYSLAYISFLEKVT
jgi:hypothetical protein